MRVKRQKHVFDTGEIPHLWAHRTQDDARNRQGNLYFTGDTIYSYGSHFPIARHVVNEAGERAVLFTTATYRSPPLAIAPLFVPPFLRAFRFSTFRSLSTDATAEAS